MGTAQGEGFEEKEGRQKKGNRGGGEPMYIIHVPSTMFRLIMGVPENKIVIYYNSLFIWNINYIILYSIIVYYDNAKNITTNYKLNSPLLLCGLKILLYYIVVFQQRRNITHQRYRTQCVK